MHLKYGKTVIELPEWVKYQAQIIKPATAEALVEPEKNITESLRSPSSGKGLQEIVQHGEKVALIVNDSTRLASTELIVPLVIRELNKCGISDQDIFIIFAEGLHRQTNDSEKVEIVGSDIASRIKMINHNAGDPSSLIEIGVTSRGTPVKVNRQVCDADRRITIGSINYHFFAGFGGGYKSLVPGVAGADTIRANHSLMLNNQSRLGVLKGNPVHEDLKEAASMVGCDFLINVILNENKQILQIFSGSIEKVYYNGCKFVEKVYGVEIKERRDLVIASCGGYPKDINIYQSQKTLENAAQAVNDNGVIILVAQCPEGHGSDKYFEWACRYKSIGEMEIALKANFEMGGHKAYAVKRVTNRCNVFLVSDLPDDLAGELGFHNCKDLESALAQASEYVKNDFQAYIMPEGSITTPIVS